MPTAIMSLDVQHDVDPKEAIWTDVRDRVAKIHPLNTQILVCVYERPKKTMGGLYLPDNDEDKWQGTVGLLVAKGELAFTDDRETKWPVKPEVGDWIVFRVGDTLRQLSGRRMLRLLDESAVRAIVDHPDIVF